MIRSVIVACALAGSLLPSSAEAGPLRCGNKLASVGASTYEVKSLCGLPDDAERRVEYRTARYRVPGPCVRDQYGRIRCEGVTEHVVEVVMDIWTYDFGKNRFIERAVFEQGRLVRTERGGYGHKE